MTPNKLFILYARDFEITSENCPQELKYAARFNQDGTLDVERTWVNLRSSIGREKAEDAVLKLFKDKSEESKNDFESKIKEQGNKLGPTKIVEFYNAVNEEINAGNIQKVTDQPEVKVIPEGAEKENKKKLSERAIEILSKNAIEGDMRLKFTGFYCPNKDRGLQKVFKVTTFEQPELKQEISYLKDVQRYLEYNKEHNVTSPTYDYDTLDYSDDTAEDEVEFGSGLSSADKKERDQLQRKANVIRTFCKRINGAIDKVNAVLAAKNDEEFVEAMAGAIDDSKLLAEMEKLPEWLHTLGLTPDDFKVANLRKMGITEQEVPAGFLKRCRDNKANCVGIASLENRFGMIASPLYYNYDLNGLKEFMDYVD
ncbi:MAG: hypothetical protein MJ072_02105, partial [Clostridia bacterium]|nr:hypothetical protein [Clostridia bacterium]